MKRDFQCAEQLKSPFNVTKYCACQEILSSRFQRQIPEVLPPIERRFEHIPNTFRTHPNTSEHKIVISHPPLRRPYSSDLGDDFVLKNTTFRAPAIQNVTKCCTCHEKSQSTFTKYCACHKNSHSTFTTYCACHEKCTLLFSTPLFSWHLFSKHLFSKHLFSWHLFSKHLFSLIF